MHGGGVSGLGTCIVCGKHFRRARSMGRKGA